MKMLFEKKLFPETGHPYPKYTHSWHIHCKILTELDVDFKQECTTIWWLTSITPMSQYQGF
jgi:hypothetical protein